MLQAILFYGAFMLLGLLALGVVVLVIRFFWNIGRKK